MRLISNHKAIGKIFIPPISSNIVTYASEKLQTHIAEIFGANIEIFKTGAVSKNDRGIALVSVDKIKSFSRGEVSGIEYDLKNDGFAVIKKEDVIYITSKKERGIFYGVCDFLEKNLEILFNRGAKGEDVSFCEKNSLDIKFFNYCENSPFDVRGWNLCGVGSEGVRHFDKGTAEYLGANKSNATFHCLDVSWRKFGLFGAGVRASELNFFDDLIDTHPEYFMVDANGKPMSALGGYDSFINYYSIDAAKEFACRLVRASENISEEDRLFWVMPDSPHFCMMDGEEVLSDKPFTTEDGVVINPTDANYKSTVYFNFLNAAIREANRLRPNTCLSVFAYLYSEPAPKISIDEHLCVYVAPICANDKRSFIDRDKLDNAAIRENIEKWTRKTKNLGVYTYWNSFRGEIYSRPSFEIVQENLVWLKEVGVKDIIVEGRVDCSISESNTASQEESIKFYDMNEPFVWLIHKLLWNPFADTNELLKRFCKIVYKECGDLMYEYFSLMKKGWDKQDGMVWYATGGDIYYLQFVVEAGIAERVRETLLKAEVKARTLSVKRKVASIRQTVEEQIKKYSDFVREDAYVAYVDVGTDQLFSEKSLDYIFNADSVWNSAKPLTVLRDYDTLEFYPKKAKFSCRMLYDDKNLYVGYTIFDDSIKYEKNGRVYREDGSELESYAETYVGGNVFNQSTYYGYISGFMGEKNSNGEFYVNEGVPRNVSIPHGVKDVKYVHFDDKNKENRYYFHVQTIPFSALGTEKKVASPYGSFVYYSNRYGRAGWMGYGLWSKQNFSPFKLLGDE